jgi:hypothetical protein
MGGRRLKVLPVVGDGVDRGVSSTPELVGCHVGRLG